MSASEFLIYSGPVEGIEYPLNIKYCGECELPIEYCEFGPDVEKCKQWLERNLPEEFDKLANIDNTNKDDQKHRQTRGGKGQVKKKKEVEHKISIFRSSRGKKKFVTVITGLTTYGIDLKVAAKYFGQKFATGSSVTGTDEIVIQGDVKDDLFEILTDKWPEINEDTIEDLGDAKRSS